MSNPRLMGISRADYFNVKGSMCVVAMYGVITIISYFNELNKAGLLKRGVYPKPLAHYRFDNARVERSIDVGNIIEKNGDIHSLGLEILKIKKDTNMHKGRHGNEGEINIKVLLGKNGSYEKVNNSVVQIYDHKNTLPNFYTSLNITLLNISASRLTSDNLTLFPDISSVIAEADKKRSAYRKATLVYMYQHDPEAYLIRECLRDISHRNHLSVNNVPISFNHRKHWDAIPRRKRGEFRVLYGGLAFGVCETLGRSCNYMTLVSHPLDRLIALYHMCHSPTNVNLKTLCRMNNAERKTTLKEFIISQGSGFFQKLVYYSKHCRLIGEDEICLQDSKVSFVFTPEEVEIHLKHVLQRLDSWFSVVGLVEELPASLDSFQHIFGHTFVQCYHDKLAHVKQVNESDWGIGENGYYAKAGIGRHKTPYLSNHQRKKLLNDPAVSKSLAADLAIYDKMVEIYKRQSAYKKALSEYKKAFRILSRHAQKKKKPKVVTAKKRVNNKHNHGVKPSAAMSPLLPVNPIGQKNVNKLNNTTENKELHGKPKNETELLFIGKKQKELKRKKRVTGHPVAGMDALLYQNYSALENHMAAVRRKKNQQNRKHRRN